MADPFVTRWAKSSEADRALTSRPGLGDIKPTGTSILRNREIPRGVIEPFSTCIDAESRRGPERPIQIIAVYMEPYMCSQLQILNRLPSLSWRLLNRLESTVFRIRMAA